MAVNPLALLGGVGVTAAAVVGGLYVSGSASANETSNTGEDDSTKATLWRPLSEDKDFSPSTNQNAYKDKWGAKYARYLVGVGTYKDDDKNKIDNTDWWNKKFKEFDKTKHTNDKFSKVESGIGTENEKSLLKVCEAAYKEQTGNVSDTGENGAKFKEENIWKYCSPLGQKPVTLDKTTSTEKSEYNSKLGGDTEESKKLVAIDDPKNALFWEIKQEEFYAGSTPDTENEKFFKDLHDNNKSTKPKDSLRDKCKAAYKLPKTDSTSTTSQPKKDEVIKYCSL